MYCCDVAILISWESSASMPWTCAVCSHLWNSLILHLNAVECRSREVFRFFIRVRCSFVCCWQTPWVVIMWWYISRLLLSSSSHRAIKGRKAKDVHTLGVVSCFATSFQMWGIWSSPACYEEINWQSTASHMEWNMFVKHRRDRSIKTTQCSW